MTLRAMSARKGPCAWGDEDAAKVGRMSSASQRGLVFGKRRGVHLTGFVVEPFGRLNALAFRLTDHAWVWSPPGRSGTGQRQASLFGFPASNGAVATVDGPNPSSVGPTVLLPWTTLSRYFPHIGIKMHLCVRRGLERVRSLHHRRCASNTRGLIVSVCFVTASGPQAAAVSLDLQCVHSPCCASISPRQRDVAHRTDIGQMWAEFERAAC